MKKLMNSFQLIVIALLICSCGTNLKRHERDREILLQGENLDNISAEKLNTYPEIYLFNESIIQEMDMEKGVIDDAFYTGTDNSRLSISMSFSQDYEDPGKVQTLDIIYQTRMKWNYKQYWWALQFKRTTAEYSAIADESTSNTTVPRQTDLQSFSFIGAGVGHRFRALAAQLESDRFFESINIYGNYVFHIDSTTKDRYQGYGYTAEYGFSYRSGRRLTYGTKLSYNWALVEREKENDESLQARSLVFGWLTLGFELGYYF